MLADAGINTGESFASLLNLLRLAIQFVHIRCRPTQIGDSSGKARNLISDFSNFTQNGFFRTTLNDSSLMFGNGAERTTTETAAHNIHGRLDHVISGNFRIAIGRVWSSLIGKVEDPVHLFGFERNRRCIYPYLLRTVFLN